MRGTRLVVALVLLALAIPAAASPSLLHASRAKDLPAPLALKGFLTRYDEPTRHVFPEQPAFAWGPSANTQHYEFQLARSSSFRDNAVIYENDTLASPTASIPITLPWVSGQGGGYGFWARARAVTTSGTTPWTKPFGFNVRWPNIPTPIQAPEGLLRWTPVVGADGYEVWEKGIYGTGANVATEKFVVTATNVIDERDWYTFHALTPDNSWYKTIHWRVRALRGASLVPTKNDFSRASYGPWSPVYTTVNTPRPLTPTALTLNDTVSDLVGTPAAPAAHGLMPGFTWSGNAGISGVSSELYRVYVFSDSDCINPVYVGAIVGSPAYAPRITGTLALPASQAAIVAARTNVLQDGSEGLAVSADFEPIVASESLNPNSAAVDPLDPKNLNTTAEDDPNIPAPTPGGDATATVVDPSLLNVDSRWVDLWDTDWPSNGYYWTVVPVFATSPQQFTTALVASAAAGDSVVTVATAGLQPGDAISIGDGGANEEANSVASVTGNSITLGSRLAKNHGAGELVTRNSGLNYAEGDLWQDACASGRVMRFGKVSQPVVTGGGKPFVSGLGIDGKVVAGSSTRTFYGVPVITWQPALGADEYEIQWSNTAYPFTPTLDKIAPGTSALMAAKNVGFKPGTYYYRVRGIDLQLPKKARSMGWSKVQKVTIAPPSYTVTRR